MAVLVSPRWRMAHEVSLPTGQQQGDGLRYLSVVQLLFISSIPLMNLTAPSHPAYTTSRSLGEDQAGIFRALEDSLAGVGVDGRACLLRLICHLQTRPIGQYTVVGEVLMLLFTRPKRETSDFLKEYQEAEMAGLDGADCSLLYPSCPFSLPPSLLPALYEDSPSGPSKYPSHSRDLALPAMVFN
ncbi:uncharacterized protein LOC123511508 isoform X3 [Portunus trituberculatus]|uniref:uncharacterized protein LOC123511508 isoform X3 n=1 Tax=Portunus trituberculatus TaxID=210409 RepID=UPI001E1CFB5D|nr:uncharacterized protein LOC123511508 isoform X3 [Portunus trituberculatus]